MRVLISLKDRNTYYFNGEGDFHCKEGVVKKEEFEKLKIQAALLKLIRIRNYCAFWLILMINPKR